jgi:hypothetical protein
MNRPAFCLSLALAVVALAPAARASDPYPGLIQEQLKLSAAPLCTICHLTLIGGSMSVTKPFGRNLMQKYGLKSQDFTNLPIVIMKDQQNGDDVDGDGVGDIAELIQGTDPNVPEGGVAVDEPRFGCYCTVPAAASSSAAPAAGLLTGLVLAGLGRRAARRARTEKKS